MTAPGVVAPDGAFTIGGGEWNYGQMMSEDMGKSMFMLPAPTPDNILTILRLALERMPIDALQAFKPIMGLADELFKDVGTAVTAILDALVVRPLNDFGAWLTDTWAGFITGFNQIMDILRGLIVTPIDTIVQGVKDFIDNVNENATSAITNTNTVVSGINQAVWNAGGNTAVGYGPSEIRYAIQHIGAQAASPNLMCSGDFEDSLILRSYLGGCTGSYDTTQHAWGSKSLKVNMTSTANGGLLLLPKSTPDGVFNDGNGFKVQPGQVFRIETRVYLPYWNPGTPSVYLAVKTYDDAGNESSQVLAGSTAIQGSWQALVASYTVPSDHEYRFMYPYLAYTAPAAGNVFHVDAVEIRSETNNSLWDAVIVGAGGSPGGGLTAVQSNVNGVRSAAAGAAGAVTTTNANVQLTWDKTYDGLTGNVGSTNQSPTSVGAAASGVRVNATNGATGASANSGNIQLTWNNLFDAFTGGAGSTGKTASEVQTAATGTQNKLNGTTDALAVGLGGLDSSGYTTTQARQAADDTRNNIAEAFNKISQLQSQAANGTFSGNAVAVDFSTYADNAYALGSSWSQSYPGGSGSGTWGISGGKTNWTLSGDTAKFGIARYAPATGASGTALDMQRVSMVVSSGFGGVGGATAANYIFGRMNGTSSYVYARIQISGGTTTMQLGYQGGLFGSPVTRAVKAGATYTLELGTSTATANALRTYTLYEGSTVVTQWTDSAGLSTYGASNRGVGLGAVASSSGSVIPCKVASFSFYDTTPPTTKGSGIRITKNNTTALSVAVNTGAVMTDGFFTNIAYQSTDISFTTAGNKVTVTKDGWYQVNITVGGSGASTGNGGNTGLVLFKNGTAAGNIVAKGAIMPFVANTTAGGVQLNTSVYLAANDFIQPGTHSTFAHSNLLTGESTGVLTHFTVTFNGNTTPS